VKAQHYDGWFLTVLLLIVLFGITAIWVTVAFPQDMLINLFADFTVVFIGMAIAWSYYKRRSKGLLKFFGLDDSRKIITIYISRIGCEPGHAIGIDGQRTTCGTETVPFRELEAANHFRELFTYPFPSLPDSSPILDRLRISDVQVQIEYSPKQNAFDPPFPFISIGGPVFNAASRFIETQPCSQIQCRETDSNETEIVVQGMGMSPSTNPYYGFIERIVSSQGPIFYTVGPSSIGSAGAAYFLATRWEKLSKEFDDDTPLLVRLRLDPNDFRCCLEVQFLKRETTN
jgi:hypothetical protein